MLSALKQATIKLGVYRPARMLHRALNPGERKNFREHRSLLSEFIKPGDLAFDVGANIGIRTEIMLSLGARVVAFEPQPLCANEVRARGNQHLTVVEAAVGAVKSTATLHLKQDSVQASLLNDWQGGPNVGTLVVPVTTLDAEIGKFGTPVFCKIDVEGFEAQVMAGLNIPIRAMSFEYHCDKAGIDKLNEIASRLAQIGSYEANLIGEENNDWLLPSWKRLEDFTSAFPSCAHPHFWGDVFVRRLPE